MAEDIRMLLSELKSFLTEIGCLVEYQNAEFLCPIALRYGYSIDAVITIIENFNTIKEYFSEDVDLDVDSGEEEAPEDDAGNEIDQEMLGDVQPEETEEKEETEEA